MLLSWFDASAIGHHELLHFAHLRQKVVMGYPEKEYMRKESFSERREIYAFVRSSPSQQIEQDIDR